MSGDDMKARTIFFWKNKEHKNDLIKCNLELDVTFIRGQRMISFNFI